MGAVLHRIEALPGEGRHAVTFRRPDGTEQTAIVHLAAAAAADGADGADGDLDVAEASLPAGWTRNSELFQVTAAAVRAFDRARRTAASAGPALRDVPGGWDVGLGNVVLGDSGVPTCTGHGEMTGDGETYTCPECGAQALFG